MIHKMLIPLCLMGLLSGGCVTYKKEVPPPPLDLVQNPPVRVHLYDKTLLHFPEATGTPRLLLLPPLGIDDPDLNQTFSQELNSSAQSHLNTPISFILADSVYAPYIAESNLILSDGTINTKEISLVGGLMGCQYVICPHIQDINPYFPQRIQIRMMIIHTQTAQTVAELTGVFDLRDSRIATYFERYNKDALAAKGSADALAYKLKSPATFQRFVTDTCSELISRKLSF